MSIPSQYYGWITASGVVNEAFQSFTVEILVSRLLRCTLRPGDLLECINTLSAVARNAPTIDEGLLWLSEFTEVTYYANVPTLGFVISKGTLKSLESTVSGVSSAFEPRVLWVTGIERMTRPCEVGHPKATFISCLATKTGGFKMQGLINVFHQCTLI